jgi:hypothetical protein
MSIQIVNNTSSLQYIVYVITTDDNLINGNVVTQIPAQFSSGFSSSGNDTTGTDILNPGDGSYLPYLWGNKYYMIRRTGAGFDTTTGVSLPELRMRSNCILCGRQAVKYITLNNPKNSVFNITQNGRLIVFENLPVPVPETTTVTGT